VRVAGESKLTGKVILNYIQHLRELYNFKFPALIPVLFVVGLVVVYLLVRRLI
jgi:dolichol-phosphate mannosyltransferase